MIKTSPTSILWKQICQRWVLPSLEVYSTPKLHPTVVNGGEYIYMQTTTTCSRDPSSWTLPPRPSASIYLQQTHLAAPSQCLHLSATHTHLAGLHPGLPLSAMGLCLQRPPWPVARPSCAKTWIQVVRCPNPISPFSFLIIRSFFLEVCHCRRRLFSVLFNRP